MCEESGYTAEKIQRLLADAISQRAPLQNILLVLNAGANPDGPVKSGLRPLHYATYENYVECMEVAYVIFIYV